MLPATTGIYTLIHTHPRTVALPITRQPSATHVERAGTPARLDSERARRMRAADIERGDRDPALPARRQQDRTVARERPQPRLPLGGIIEPLRGGVEMPGHVLQPQRRIGRVEMQVERSEEHTSESSH